MFGKKRRIKVEEIWQSSLGSYRDIGGAGAVPPDTKHIGCFSIRYDGEIVGHVDIFIVDRAFKQAKLYVRWENMFRIGHEIEVDEKFIDNRVVYVARYGALPLLECTDDGCVLPDQSNE